MHCYGWPCPSGSAGSGTQQSEQERPSNHTGCEHARQHLPCAYHTTQQINRREVRPLVVQENCIRRAQQRHLKELTLLRSSRMCPPSKPSRTGSGKRNSPRPGGRTPSKPARRSCLKANRLAQSEACRGGPCGSQGRRHPASERHPFRGASPICLA